MSAGPNEAAQYGMVTACYFGIFMYRYRQGLIVTDRRAMVNIAVLFMLAQPLCRIASGINGLFTFAALCMSSLILFPSPQQDRQSREEREKKKKAQEERKKSKKKKS
ncbi:uncharacterized protein LOC143470226 [Clavelina lepadiformis]|uniref:uncharacterized protein LOC143470226 n=1 Tax=Clavelina lepadiformis TaxID=159417 RepID=UPI004041386D